MDEADKDDKPKSPGGEMFAHIPLPYIVRVQEHEVHLMAYSVLEAMVAGPLKLGSSGIEDTRCKVIGVEPDMAAFFRSSFGLGKPTKVRS